MRSSRPTIASASAALGLVLLGFGEKGPAQEARPGPTARQEAVVQQACSGCHAVPAPDVLPRDAWRSVVVDMAGLMIQGIGAPKDAAPLSADFDVEQVAYYYERRAPGALPSPAPWPPADDTSRRFVRRPISFAGATAPAAVANVRFLGLDGGAPSLVAADLLAGLVLGGPPPGGLRLWGRVAHPCHLEAADLDRDGRVDLLVADLGAPAPSDQRHGRVVWLRRLPGGDFERVVLAEGLPRVADVQAGDFDGDGDLDLVVAAFGWRKVGGILLLENRTAQGAPPSFVARELDDRPGTVHVPVADLDRDGRLDFVALISQQHESVVAFLGDGKGGFRKEVVDRASHPAWGSSGLQLVDLDRDGDLDALVTNGDMLDDYQLKPYHGIRWLENRGRFPFEAHELAPLFGVMRAQAADLDGDGDLDVVACAMVQSKLAGGEPIRHAGQPSLVWLEQTAPGRYERHTLERGSQHLSLDLADYDRDGDTDIATASSLSGASAHVEIWENAGVPRAHD